MIYNKQIEREQIQKQLNLLFAETGTNLRSVCLTNEIAYKHWVYALNYGHINHDELQDLVKATNAAYCVFNNNGTIQIRKR